MAGEFTNIPIPPSGSPRAAQTGAHPGVRGRTVLMVLYHFPPVGGVSVGRNVRNVQYLPRYGWNPIVLAPRTSVTGLSDPSGLRLIPDGAQVIRTQSLEAGHARRLAETVRRLIRGRVAAGQPRTDRGVEARNSESVAAVDRRSDSPLGLGWLRRLLFFPDDQIGWLPFACVAAYRLHRTMPVNAIYSTSSPVTAHLIAGLTKRLTGAPWIAEFRDPWIGNALAPRLPALHRRLRARLERWIVHSADRVVCVTPSMSRMYQQRYPNAAVVTIPNGYDPSEIVVRPRGGGNRIRYRIVYAGTLDRPLELALFLDGLEAFAQRRPDLRDLLEVIFYGAVSPACRAIADAKSKGALAAMIRFAGYVPRDTAVQALADADAALVLLGPGPGMEVFVGGKLYEYLGQNLQILAMLPPGDARDVLAELDWGVVADPEPSSVADAVERLLALPAPDRPADPAGRYDRAALAGRLAECLSDASPNRTAPQASGR